MQKARILVTGGAGFIGSWLTDKLITGGYKVRILDNLEPQVHNNQIPQYLNKEAEFVKGDIRSLSTFTKTLKDIEIVYHLASSVGVAQSNYQIRKYAQTNVIGTANLAQILTSQKNKVEKVLFPASMTGLGEGYYYCTKHKKVRPGIRKKDQLEKRDWHLHCSLCGKIVKPIPTDETAAENPSSVYAITKRAQQDILLTLGQIYQIPTVGLRLFNVYGPRQSLSNPYTGVTAIFISRFKNNQPVVVYEDGKQSRDFVSIHDVIRAFILAMLNSKADGNLINIGSGKPTSIKKVAETLSKNLGKTNLVNINHEYRINDIRHCYADISKAKELLGWEPKVSLEKGFKELIDWGSREKAVDKFKSAEKQLRTKGLL